MKYRSMLLAGAVLVFVFQGCAAGPTFPENDAATLKASSEFGVLAATPDTYQGRAVRLAGRMVSVETTDQGTMIVAEWLPFPEPGEYGPASTGKSTGERFTLRYPGRLDPMGSWHGNKFVVAGAMRGTSRLITIDGLSKSVPHVEARCLHVWKTGDSELSDAAPDVEQTGFPPLEQTYCSNA